MLGRNGPKGICNLIKAAIVSLHLLQGIILKSVPLKEK
jgi:hypothetical protein